MARRLGARGPRTGGAARRGSSFVEVLLAMTIMALVLVGILQMFSVSLIINKGSAARTQMLFKCQQVVENLRWYYYVTSHSLAAPGGTDIPALATAALAPVKVDLPYVTGDSEWATWAFWGPGGANVMEVENGPYKISYRIESDDTQNCWVVTVSAVPTDVPGTSGASRYLGIGTNGGGKRVDYASVFSK